MTDRFDHGHEPRAEEIALHQRFLTLQAQIEAASAEGDSDEVDRIGPLLERGRQRWIGAQRRVRTGRGHVSAGSPRTCGSPEGADLGECPYVRNVICSRPPLVPERTIASQI